MENFFGTFQYINGAPAIRVSRHTKQVLKQLKCKAYYVHNPTYKRRRKQYYVPLCGGVVYAPSGEKIHLRDKKRLLKYRSFKTYTKLYNCSNCPHCNGYFLFTHIVKQSRRIRWLGPVYKEGLVEKEECFICREKRMLHYCCDTCTFRSCYKCMITMQQTTLDCPQCRHGMLPWGAHL